MIAGREGPLAGDRRGQPGSPLWQAAVMQELLDVAGDSLERFLVRWYGPPDQAAARPPNGPIAVPCPLQDYYELTSRWSRPLAVQNHLLGPDEVQVQDGKLVFWVENQGVWVWACDRAGDDPLVFDRENEPGAPWQPTGAALSEFLLQVAVFEAVMGARLFAAGAGLTPGQLDAALAPLRPLPMSAWHWPAGEHRLYAGPGLLAFAGPNPRPGETAQTATERELFLAAQDAEHLDYARGLEGVDWDAWSWSDA